MGIIRDIKDQFQTEEVYLVYKDCMYLPDYEKYKDKAGVLLQNPDLKIYGMFKDKELLGVIAIVGDDSGNYEIKGIAVKSGSRKMGVGKQLIEYVRKELRVAVLKSETDDDAVQFYKNCGFDIQEIYKVYGTKKVKRYNCVLLSHSDREGII